MANFLLGHELQEVTILAVQSLVLEVLLGEGGETPVEEVKLDVLLVQAESDGLVVEIGLNSVHGGRPVGALSASRCIRGRLVGVKLAVCWVGILGWVRWQSRDRRGENTG